MSDLTHLFISITATLKETIQILDLNGQQICLVVDNNHRLLGTVSDGDIRRAILHGTPLGDPVNGTMNSSPHVAYENATTEELTHLMVSNNVNQIPILSVDDKVIGLETLAHQAKEAHTDHDNWVFLMAGGLGTRLKPFTDNQPKPLMEVGDTPILETIIIRCVAQRFRKFYISINYKADMIRSFCGDGSKWGAKIHFLEEEEPLGTAGSLSLLPEIPSKPLIVMNADIMSDVNLRNLLDYHKDQSSSATMGIKEYDLQIPFGVVKTNGTLITHVEEKPIQKYFINAGVYAINPDILGLVEPNRPMDMTDLFELAIHKNLNTSAFPVFEQWADIGRLEDLERARKEN